MKCQFLPIHSPVMLRVIKDGMSFIFDEIERWASTASAGELLFVVLLFFTCIEQILYLFPATYVYRKGIPIRRIPVSNEHISMLTDKDLQPRNLSSKMEVPVC